LDATCGFGWCGYPRKKVLHIKEIAGMLTFKDQTVGAPPKIE